MIADENLHRKSNVSVYLRIRPPNSEYTFIDSISEDKKSVKITKDFEIRTFSFNKIFTPKDPQLKVSMTSCSNVLRAVLNGFNGCIIAYGQTGSGKTFTVLGEPATNIQGVLQYSLATLLSTKKDISLELSGMEIYMDKIYDILANNSNNSVSVNYTASKGATIKNISKYRISSLAELEVMVKLIIKNRKTQTTRMNVKSSRSHAIFSVTVHNPEYKESAVLNIVDLAGSERVKKSQTLDARSMDETISINTSLSALSKCIFTLTKNDANCLSNSITHSLRSSANQHSKSPDRPNSISKRPQSISSGSHVPYRDSKLTMVLQNVLSGKSHLSLIITLSPDDLDVEESFSALRFANCAMKLEMAPERPEKKQRKKSPEFNVGDSRSEAEDDIIIERQEENYCTSRFTESDNNYVTNFTFDDSKVRTNQKYGTNADAGRSNPRGAKNPGAGAVQSERNLQPKSFNNHAIKTAEDDRVASLLKQIKELKVANDKLAQENDDLRFVIEEYKYKHESVQCSHFVKESDFPMLAEQDRSYLLYNKQSVHPDVKKHLSSTKQHVDNLKHNIATKTKVLERLVLLKYSPDYAQFVREHIAAKRILKFMKRKLAAKPKKDQNNHFQKLKIVMGKNLLSQLMKRTTSQLKAISALVKSKEGK